MNLKEAIVATIKEIVQTAVISLGIFLFVYVFLVQPHRVQGVSMERTFENGELLLTEKISYHVSRIQRGDVIVFKAPIEKNADFIKRVIGLPGDELEVKDNSVYINGLKLDEPYISVPTEGDTKLTIPKDEIFVMGDNRTSSSDSRSFGPIAESSIEGKVWLVYWPIFKSDQFPGTRIISHVHYSIPD